MVVHSMMVADIIIRSVVVRIVVRMRCVGIADSMVCLLELLMHLVEDVCGVDIGITVITVANVQGI